MALTGIAYSGGPNIKADFAADTIADIVAGIKANLLLANWTASTGSGDENLLSGTTSQGLNCRVGLYTSGAGIHSQIKFENFLSTRLGQSHYLTPSAGRVLRIIANPFFFLVLRPAATGSASNGTFVCGGVPKLEDHMTSSVKECIFSHGDIQSGAVTFADSFRTSGRVGGSSNSWNNVNGDMMSTQAWTTAGADGIGKQCLLAPFGYTPGNSAGFNDRSGYLFIDGEGFKTPARICWGLTSADTEPHIRGYIWDGAATTGQYPEDVTDSYDSHTFYNVTFPNTYFASAGLWMVVP